eukprot:TRINITY_DN19300_c0_g1_i1.p1 TRINITY_DN19300_c0_g1~~TRINITY_DN19300_c0_g1_i1.p1  ORF type:complete len:294 (-),score=38.33 TRINITY_DN19300_c0_g1_i1:19-861(-)
MRLSDVSGDVLREILRALPFEMCFHTHLVSRRWYVASHDHLNGVWPVLPDLSRHRAMAKVERDAELVLHRLRTLVSCLAMAYFTFATYSPLVIAWWRNGQGRLPYIVLPMAVVQLAVRERSTHDIWKYRKELYTGLLVLFSLLMPALFNRVVVQPLAPEEHLAILARVTVCYFVSVIMVHLDLHHCVTPSRAFPYFMIATIFVYPGGFIAHALMSRPRLPFIGLAALASALGSGLMLLGYKIGISLRDVLRGLVRSMVHRIVFAQKRPNCGQAIQPRDGW